MPSGPSHLSPLDDHTLDRVAAQVRDHMAQSSMKRDLLKWALEIALAVVVAWGTVNTRVTVLEARFDDMKATITEIRQDVKTLLLRHP